MPTSPAQLPAALGRPTSQEHPRGSTTASRRVPSLARHLAYLSALCSLGTIGCAGVSLAGTALDPPTCSSASCAKQACDAGDAAECGTLGQQLLTQSHDAAEESQAYALLFRACQGGSGRHCTIVARGYEQGTTLPRSASTAASLFERACIHGDAEGCLDLAELIERQAVSGPPGRARMLVDAACTLGSAEACARSENAKRPRVTAAR